jgi:8-amino-7-oxononanoate synthase
MAELPFDTEQKRALLRQILQGRGADTSPMAARPAPHPTGTHGLEESPEVAAWFARMEQLGGLGLRDPCFRTLDGPAAGVASIDGRTVIDFCGYNYLGLAADPRVKNAAKDAIERYGTSASASRLASGERPLHQALERKLAGFLGVEDALVFSAGYGTNVSVLGHVLTPSDLVIHDELAHNSIILGSQLSRARRVSFPHNDLRALEDLLLRNRADSGNALVVVEGAYSMDGDVPDLPALITLARRHSASLFIDEAHSLGVLGRSGRGIGEHFGVDRHDVELWMGTLSKSLSSVGGYVAGSQRLIRYLKYTVPGFIFSAGLPPASAASALESLEIIEQEPWRVEKLQANAHRFLERARAAGLDTGLSGGTAVVPIIVHNSVQCLRVAAQLFDDGINVFPMTYPAVAETEARLRFFMSSEHTSDQIDSAVTVVAHAVMGTA